MKSNNRFTRFSLRGLAKVDIEFGLMALAHNLDIPLKESHHFGDESHPDYRY
jgi:hypothetical protein